MQIPGRGKWRPRSATRVEKGSHPGEFVRARKVEGAHGHAHRQHEGVAADLAAVGERHDPIGFFDADLRRLLRFEQFGPEALRLGRRPAGEVGAGDARRETEIVLDVRRRARLSAGDVVFDEERVQAFG